MTDLSPAAQSVYNAILKIWPARINEIAAAALQAAADQVVPEEDVMPFIMPEDGELSLQRRCQRRRTRAQFLAIADELKTLTTETND